MLINTARADVPAATNMGRPTTLVRNGTYRKPPPTPKKDEMALMKKPPTKAQIGLKVKVCPKKEISACPRLNWVVLAPDWVMSPFSLMVASNALAAALEAFFFGLPPRRHFINHEPADDENDQAEVSLVLGKLDFSHGGVNHQEGRQQRPQPQGDPQGNDQAFLLGVVGTRNSGGQAHEPLVGDADAVGDELVQVRGRVLERLGIGAQAEDGDMAHTGQHAAESADRREYPADPD